MEALSVGSVVARSAAARRALGHGFRRWGALQQHGARTRGELVSSARAELWRSAGLPGMARIRALTDLRRTLGGEPVTRGRGRDPSTWPARSAVQLHRASTRSESVTRPSDRGTPHAGTPRRLWLIA